MRPETALHYTHASI